MRHRDTRIRGGGDSGGDAGHDFEIDAGLRQRQRLLASPAEEVRVAALQAHHGLTLFRFLDEKRVYLVLFERVSFGRLADIDEFALSQPMATEAGMHQPVEEDNIGPGDALGPLDRYQAGVTRPCADQKYPAVTHAPSHKRNLKGSAPFRFRFDC